MLGEETFKKYTSTWLGTFKGVVQICADILYRRRPLDLCKASPKNAEAHAIPRVAFSLAWLATRVAHLPLKVVLSHGMSCKTAKPEFATIRPRRACGHNNHSCSLLAWQTLHFVLTAPSRTPCPPIKWFQTAFRLGSDLPFVYST